LPSQRTRVLPVTPVALELRLGYSPYRENNHRILKKRVPRAFAVIPAYRASATLAAVVEQCLGVVDHVIVVDDACPENCSAVLSTGAKEPRVTVVRRGRNGGVGAATKDGIAEALRLGAEVIVKVDADGQMDTRYVPHMIEFLGSQPEVDLVKGNRFADPATLRRMPVARLIGNAGLTFLVKFSSGYWTIVDPTNGFIAARASALRRMNLDVLSDRYFFEIDLLCSFGLARRAIAELEMPAIYGDESSSLSIRRALLTFPGRLLSRFLKRLLVNYLIVEINVGTVCAVVGIPLLIAGVVFGSHEWLISVASGPRPTGVIILALLLFILGFQLTMQALFYDIQFSTRTVKIRRDPEEDVASEVASREVFFA
jgi:glycosyltransferase involved in cell wall biosynthesis